MGHSTLVVDLGRLSLSSAPTTSAQPEQQHTGRGAGVGGGLMSLSVWPEVQGGGQGLAGPALSAEEAAVYEVGASAGV